MVLVEKDPHFHPVEIFNIPITPWRLGGLLEWVDFCLQNDRENPKTIMYANVHTLNIAHENPEFNAVLRSADTVYCDGSGIRLGAFLYGKHLPARMTGADWIHDLCNLSMRRRYRLFLLGGEEGIAEQASSVLLRAYPELIIAGTHHGYFHRSPSQREALLSRLAASEIDILLVGMGSPLQEFWIRSNKKKFSIPITWAMGAAMDFVVQKVPRAPRWMCDHHMEWLFRLKTEPVRLWRRYLIGNFLFLLRILKTGHSV